MKDKFGRQIKTGDIVLHLNKGNLYTCFVIEDHEGFIGYVVLQESQPFFYKKYRARSSNKVIIMEPTPEFMNSVFRDCRGLPKDSRVLVKDAVKFTIDECASCE